MADRRKLENIAFTLSLFGAIAMVPPIISLFNVEKTIFGVPLIIIYLFGLWLFLIIATFLLSKRMINEDRPNLEEGEKSGAGNIEEINIENMEGKE